LPFFFRFFFAAAPTPPAAPRPPVIRFLLGAMMGGRIRLHENKIL
jgi:hypothetical protein